MVQSQRLNLVVLPEAWLVSVQRGQVPDDLGFTDPYGFLANSAHLVEMRLAQLRDDPASSPWLLRAMVLRESGVAIGYVNFHDRPDERGMVEIGYTVVPEMRRRGFAREAARAMWAWAGANGARVLRASVAPGNAASLGLIRTEGFEKVGEQLDPIDGLELVYEKDVAPTADSRDVAATSA